MQRSTINMDPTRAEVGNAGDVDVNGRGLSLLLLVAGCLGLVASVGLLVEKIARLEDPDHILSCDVSPVLSCGSVMDTWQAEVFVVPNPIIGVAGFAAITTIGAALLGRGAFSNWLWKIIQAGVSFAVIFVHWFAYQSLYVIDVLCPYCLVVWAVTIPIFWYVTVHNLQLTKPNARITRRVTEYRGMILTAWYLLLIALIAVRFWDYWITIV